jgi:hypothetical protein
MNRSRSSFLACLGILALAHASHLGATIAGAQANIVATVALASPAGVVSPANSTVPPQLFTSPPGVLCKVKVGDVGNFPVPNCLVELNFAGGACNPCSTSACGSCDWNAQTRILGTWTDQVGEATFPIYSGGYSGPDYAVPVRADGSFLGFTTCKAAAKTYTFTICVTTELIQMIGHAFVVISDGEETLYSGVHPRHENDAGLLTLLGVRDSADVRDDSRYKDTQTSQITWTITAQQYANAKTLIAGLKTLAEQGKVLYSLYGFFGLSCMSFCEFVANAIGISIPSTSLLGKLGPTAAVPDPWAFQNMLFVLLASGQGWPGATISRGPGCLWQSELAVAGATAAGVRQSGEEECSGDSLDSITPFIVGAIERPTDLAGWFIPSPPVVMAALPDRVGAPGQELTFVNPAPCADSCFVFWNFADADSGVVGSPLQAEHDGQVSHAFVAPGTYHCTLVEISASRLYHGSWTTIVYDGAGGGSPAPEFALHGVRPNPTGGGALTVHFALPAAGRASLELLDVSGRRIAVREVGGLGAGAHAVDLGDGRGVAPGVYLVRLTRGADLRVARVVVLK